jgi:hypothetical protein
MSVPPTASTTTGSSTAGSTTAPVASPALSERDAAVAAYKRKFLEHRDVESSMYTHIYTYTFNQVQLYT